MTSNDPPKFTPKIPGKEANRRPLPKRFYKQATYGPAKDSTTHQLLLDSRPAKTPLKRALALPTHGLAAAIAAEWNAQRDLIDPASMPLTTLACTTIDAVTDKSAEVSAEIIKYAGNDLLCYRAEGPQRLVDLQSQHWDPILAWAKQSLGARFTQTKDLMPITQPPEAQAAISSALKNVDSFTLAGMHVLTTILGSAVLATAVLKRHLTFDAAWTAAHVDEDWQITQWGADHDAEVRRQKRHAEAKAAAQTIDFLRTIAKS
jgi:chaperone required for assembly of F1-ATPase